MFKPMRRFRQELSPEVCADILSRNTSGVLALSGNGDFPYAVPLSYVYENSRLYFHCAASGHKLDLLSQNNRVSFCVVDQDQVVPEEYTTYFRSVIVFGTAKILDNFTEKRRALELLAAKYSPMQEKGRMEEIDKLFNQVCMVEISIDHMSGKEAIELVNARER